MTITEYLDAALDRADAVYKASDRSIGKKVDELSEVLTAVVHAVKLLDARDS